MDHEAVHWALRTTRSVRRRIDFERPVDPAVIEECIDVAVQAPTGAGGESWRFLVLTDPEPKARLAELYRSALARWEAVRSPALEPPKSAIRQQAAHLHEMPALVLVCTAGRAARSLEPRHAGGLLSARCSRAAWSLMVALRARGLGATWTTLHLLHAEKKPLALGIPDGVTQTVLLPVGWTRDAKLRPADRAPAREVTYWNRWGATREPDSA